MRCTKMKLNRLIKVVALVGLLLLSVVAIPPSIVIPAAEAASPERPTYEVLIRVEMSHDDLVGADLVGADLFVAEATADDDVCGREVLLHPAKVKHSEKPGLEYEATLAAPEELPSDLYRVYKQQPSPCRGWQELEIGMEHWSLE